MWKFIGTMRCSGNRNTFLLVFALLNKARPSVAEDNITGPFLLLMASTLMQRQKNPWEDLLCKPELNGQTCHRICTSQVARAI
jgi:hypothetical protein